MLYQFWRTLSLLGTKGLQDPLFRNRIIFSNQINFCSWLVVLIYSVVLWGFGHTPVLVFLLVYTLGAAATALLLRYRYYTLGRLLLIAFTSISLYVYIRELGGLPAVGVFFFPILLLPAICFDTRERGLLVLGIGLAVAAPFWLLWAIRRPTNPVVLVPPPMPDWVALSMFVAAATLTVLIFRLYQHRVTQYLFRLLAESRNQVEELQSQEEELRQNTEEMQTTQDQMAHVQDELRRKNEQLERSAQRMTEAQQQLREALAQLQHNQRQLELQRIYDRGVAELTTSLHWDGSLSLATWADTLMAHLVTFSEATLGCLYVPDRLYQPGNTPYLGVVGAFGLPEGLEIMRVAWGEGMVGETARSRRTRHLKGLSDQNLVFQLSFDRLAPTDILVQPLVSNDTLEGVIYLASAKPLSEPAVLFYERVAPLVAASLETIRSQTQIRTLLQESEEKTRQLEENELLLHRNIEKLVASQRDMRFAQRQLEANENKLRELNEHLERRVTERTQALEEALADLKSTQIQLVQSEKMASLGQLIAGIAHEINTPVGAIKASADNIRDLLPPLLRDLPQLLDHLGPDTRVLFDRLVGQLMATTRQLTSKEERSLRKQYATLLAEAQVDEADELARRIVEAGFLDELAPYLPLLAPEHRELMISTLFSIGQLRVNADNIGIAVEKTRKIVFALKNYVYRQRDNKTVPVNLQQNIDTILTLYHNQLKYNIEVTTDYQPVPEVEAFPDELGQVWTNLLYNAIQAMDGKGTFSVSVRPAPEPGYVAVEMVDDGPGIPPEVQPHVFEPFFTTRRRGEGTGLGLHLVQKIVERHHGSIHLESAPGRTAFTVILPITQPEPILPLVDQMPSGALARMIL